MAIYITANENTKFNDESKKVESWLRLRNNNIINAVDLIKSCADVSFEKICKVLYAAIDVCDHVFVLKGWRESVIAKSQLSYAKSLKKHIIFEEHYKDFNPKRGRRIDKVGKYAEGQDIGLPGAEQFERDGVCGEMQADGTDNLCD